MSPWPEAARDIIGGDIVAAFAYTTRFGGVSVAPVCPFGMFDEDAQTIETSVPLAFVDKLQRLAQAPQAALGFFSRSHGLSATPGFVLAQGDVTFPDTAPDGYLDALHDRWAPYLGPVPQRGLVRALGGGAYYDRRLPVTLHVRRLLWWPDGDAGGAPDVAGEARPNPPAPQHAPKQGTEPLVATRRYAKQLERDEHHLVGFVDGDGRPFLVPFTPEVAGDRLAVPRTDLPAGGRRAAIMGFWCKAQLHGQGFLGARGWLEVGDAGATFAPSATSSFNLSMGAFGQKVIVPIALGFQYRKAVRAGAVRQGTLVRPS